MENLAALQEKFLKERHEIMEELGMLHESNPRIMSKKARVTRRSSSIRRSSEAKHRFASSQRRKALAKAVARGKTRQRMGANAYLTGQARLKRGALLEEVVGKGYYRPQRMPTRHRPRQ